ncbi:hypothetical protein [Aquihabitans sp. McL0605]|uniref:hypothetical protein n=1 Tax=Aquihabitans sp. McL0605 TaxID=3415671 RepID=UPI003CF8F2B1
MTDLSDAPVITPPGLPILDAAGWVGRACWAELRLSLMLTHWLAVEPDPAASAVFWAERSDAADRAEGWHRRLPELREFPRESFINASSDAVADLFNDLTVLDAPEGTELRRGALAAVLRGLRLGYHAHQDVVVGPADGPTATTLNAALRSTFGVGGFDPDPAWTEAVDAAGGLP